MKSICRGRLASALAFLSHSTIPNIGGVKGNIGIYFTLKRNRLCGVKIFHSGCLSFDALPTFKVRVEGATPFLQIKMILDNKLGHCRGSNSLKVFIMFG